MVFLVVGVLIGVLYICYKLGMTGGNIGQITTPQQSVTDMAGLEGELVVSNLLGSLGSDYIVLNDILLGTNGGYTQIDHIVVSIYGIFIIETKNYTGLVKGSETQRQWSHYKRNGTGHNFYNPILQNKAHCIAVCNILGLQLPDVVPIVVFSNKCDLQVSCTSNVVNIGNLLGVFRRYSSPRLNRNQVQFAVNRIMSMNVTDPVARKAHLNQVSVKQAVGTYGRSFVFTTGKCPNCGADMILRNGKYGQFYGCSNYPRCKYTAKLS